MKIQDVSRALYRSQSSLTAQRRPQSTFTHHLYRNAPIDVHPEVSQALASSRAVVALESTIITHGMPFPQNLQTAQSVEKVVRSTGAIPATIALIRGRVKIGLGQSELEYIADPSTEASKISRRDIAPAIALSKNGGTTCSATLIFAAMAGIKVFATGGLGGVHRGGENSLDISADLLELSRCPVGLVAAGCKSILDIGRTLEYLETLGVPVISYGSTTDFPAFYSPRSGFQAPWNVEDASIAAQMLYTHRQLSFATGMLFGVPIPTEYEEIGRRLQEAVEIAVAEAEANGMSKRGKEATPWMLKRIGDLTDGSSLTSNIALIENNALTAGRIAVEYAKLICAEDPLSQFTSPISFKWSDGLGHPAHLKMNSGLPRNPLTKLDNLNPVCASVQSVTVSQPSHIPKQRASLLVIGTGCIDITSQSETAQWISETTNPGIISMTYGGVARNCAEAAHRILVARDSLHHDDTALVSIVGEDRFGGMLLDHMKKLDMRVDAIKTIKAKRTAVCNLMLDINGDLQTGIADMDIFKSLSGEMAVKHIDSKQPALVALDGNLEATALMAIVRHCHSIGIPCFFEPTSVHKSTRILEAVTDQAIDFVSPNILELTQIYNTAESLDMMDTASWWECIDRLGIGSRFRLELEILARQHSHARTKTPIGDQDFLIESGISQMAVKLLPFFRRLLIKCGDRGVVVVMRLSDTDGIWGQTSLKDRRIVVNGENAEVVIVQHFLAPTVPDGVEKYSTGTGDTFVGGILAALTLDPSATASPDALSSAINMAQQAAALTLTSPDAVAPALSSVFLDQQAS